MLPVACAEIFQREGTIDDEILMIFFFRVEEINSIFKKIDLNKMIVASA